MTFFYARTLKVVHVLAVNRSVMGTIRSLRRTPMQSALSGITFNAKVFGNFFLKHNKGGTFRRAAAGAAHKFVQTNHGRSA